MSLIENTTFNIVEFIEKNPLKKLNNTYQNILLNKIKAEFNEKEQDLFVTSFYCYLNFNPTTDFVIDFDDVRKWCGFTRKDNAKRLLEKYFTIDIDYIVNVITPPFGGVISKERGGAHKKEKILLNIKTFKKFCLKSDTKKADEIHNYYIKLEEILQDILLQQTEELKLQLEMKNIELGEKNFELNQKNIKLEETEEEVEKLSRKYIKKPKLVSNEKNVVYLMSTAESEKKGEYIVGKATNLADRKENYDHNKLHDFKVIYNISCGSSKLMDVLESVILTKMGKYRCKKNRDVFLLPSGENTTIFINIFDACLKFYEDVDESCIVYPKRTLEKMDKDEMRKKNEIYHSENKDQIKENNKEYYNDNKEILAEIKKVYYDKNSDMINKKNKKYYEENKVKVIANVMEYYDTNKEKILVDRKDFYEDNKEQILDERAKYYKDNYKTKIAVQRQKKETCECGMIISHYCMKKHQKSARHQLLMEKLAKPQ